MLTGPLRTGVVVAAGPLAAYAVFDDRPRAVVALVDPRGVRLPLGMQVPALPTLRAGATAHIGASRLLIGPHGWRPARWWDPRPRLDPADVVALGPRLATLLDNRRDVDFGIDRGVGDHAAERLADGDARAACAVLGRGPGFTPAGDDVVAGALAGLALAGAVKRHARATVLSAASDRTTALSAALLGCAGRGEVIPAVSRLLTAMVNGATNRDVELATRSVFGVGATSGAAMLLGLSAALTALTRGRSRHRSQMETT